MARNDQLRWRQGEFEQVCSKLSLLAPFEALLLLIIPHGGRLWLYEAAGFALVNLVGLLLWSGRVRTRSLPDTEAGVALYELTVLGVDSKDAYHKVFARAKANKVGLATVVALGILVAAAAYLSGDLTPIGGATLLIPVIVLRLRVLRALHPKGQKVPVNL